MSADLRTLRGTLEGLRQRGAVTLAAGVTGVAELDGFLATLPGGAITLKRAVITADDPERPASLTVAGSVAETWPVPGPAGLTLTIDRATVSLRSDGDAVAGSLEVSATATVGTQALPLRGTAAGATLRFSLADGKQRRLSLAEAAVAIIGPQATSYLPAGVPVFDSLRLTSATVAFGYWIGATTELSLELLGTGKAGWELVPGSLALRNVSATLGTAYRTSRATGGRASFAGQVRGTLRLGQADFEVTVPLIPGHRWELAVAPGQGLPSLADLAAVTGADPDLAQRLAAGLRSLGAGEITPQSVRLFADRHAGHLAGATVRGSAPLAGAHLDAEVSLPGFEVAGALADPASLTLDQVAGDAGAVPDVAVSGLSLHAAPAADYYELAAEVGDGQLAADGRVLSDVAVEIVRAGSEVTATVTATISADGSPLAEKLADLHWQRPSGESR